MDGNVAARELIAVSEVQSRTRPKDALDFEELLRRYGRQVVMTALRILGNMADAEDASQEVFLRLHKYWRRFDPARAVEPWLYRMTVNAALDLRRKRRELPLEPATDLAAPEESSLNVDHADQREQMRRALQELPEKMRAAVVLRDIEGLTTKQVAEILGSTETTVRSDQCGEAPAEGNHAEGTVNCREFEGLIALHVSGDLSPEEAATVERHLDECDVCRALAVELRECQIVLTELGAERPGENVYSSLLARLSAASVPRRGWAWALAAAAAVLLGLACVVWQYAERQKLRTARVEVARATVPPPEVPEISRPVTKPVAASSRPKRKVRRAPAPKPEFRKDAEPLVMKLLTDDPNVVIYWIVEGTGE